MLKPSDNKIFWRVAKVVQETRLFDPDNDETRSMRSKEVANDYRYFPDPDLLPIVIDDETIERIRDALPELPAVKRGRYTTELGLSQYDANLLTQDRATAEFFEACLPPRIIPRPQQTGCSAI